MREGESLYLNAAIHTMDEAQPKAEAMLVRGDRIAATGSREDMEHAAPPGARRVDLAGGTVVPGFNDSHCHLLWIGMMLRMVDVSVDAVRSIEDIRASVGRRVAETPAGDWVLGRGYDQNMLVDRR